MDREDNVLASAAQAYLKSREQAEKQIQEQFDRLKPAANRIFSTEDGKILARQMIKACHLLETEPAALVSGSFAKTSGAEGLCEFVCNQAGRPQCVYRHY